MTNKQRALPAAYVRGGTSRAVIFKHDDLPAEREQWKPIFQAVLGSPDPESKQLDGLGGGLTSLSKIAVLRPSGRQDADVDYLFVQVEPVTGDTLFDANCGNISSAVGPFAVDEGWLSPDAEGKAVVRIFNENTGKIIESHFSVNTSPEEHIEIAGVAGRAAPILLRFKDPEGSLGNGAFPSGNTLERLELPGGRSVSVTLVDINVPCAIVHADEVGMKGDETYNELTANAEFVSLMTEIRVASAVRMKICSTAKEARESVLNVPDVIVISRPANGEPGLTARFVSCDRPHRAAPVTSSMALAATSHIPGTVAAATLGDFKPRTVIIGHPSGTVEVSVELRDDGHIAATSTLRTARRIMQGEVLIPALA